MSRHIQQSVLIASLPSASIGGCRRRATSVLCFASELASFRRICPGSQRSIAMVRKIRPSALQTNPTNPRIRHHPAPSNWLRSAKYQIARPPVRPRYPSAFICVHRRPSSRSQSGKSTHLSRRTPSPNWLRSAKYQIAQPPVRPRYPSAFIGGPSSFPNREKPTRLSRWTPPPNWLPFAKCPFRPRDLEQESENTADPSPARQSRQDRFIQNSHRSPLRHQKSPSLRHLTTPNKRVRFAKQPPQPKILENRANFHQTVHRNAQRPNPSGPTACLTALAAFRNGPGMVPCKPSLMAIESVSSRRNRPRLGLQLCPSILEAGEGKLL
jgi:hypothetical protein